MTATVHAIATKDYLAAEICSAGSRLDCTKLEGVFRIKLLAWQDGVVDCLASLISATSAGPK